MFNRFPKTARLDRHVVHHVRLFVIVPLTISLLVACGDDDSPTPPPTTSPPTVTTSAATATATTAPIVSTASPIASPVAAGVTAGELANRIGAAWSNVTSYRTTTTTTAIDSTTASPAASNPMIVTIAEVIPPDRKHWVSQSGGVTQYEFIAVDGRIYGRGPAVPRGDDGKGKSNSWFEIDLATVDIDSVFATLFAQLLAPVTAPYASLSAEEMSRDAVPVDPVSVDGQTCAAYRIADTTQTGERIEVVIALGEDDLPCSIETRGGGQQTVTTYAYNLPLPSPRRPRPHQKQEIRRQRPAPPARSLCAGAISSATVQAYAGIWCHTCVNPFEVAFSMGCYRQH